MEEPRALFDRVLVAYAAEGFSADIIGQWSIPTDDAIDLVTLVRERRPKSVLEVGTFVGVSTMLTALAGSKATRIVSIDPNFPLAVEMNSMGSRLGSLDASARTHDVAAAVARRLGVADQIKFLSGGFSSGSSFASRRTSPNLSIPVIGPDICERYGPFDLAFIDGLHYADVVESDVMLASRHVAHGGVILMHDCVGAWGTNVRVGLSRFLAEFPDWRLLHPPLSGLYRSIGILFRYGHHHEFETQLLRKPRVPIAVEVQLQALATSIIKRLQPSHVIELTHDEPVFWTKFDKTVPVETVQLGQNGLDVLAARHTELAQGGEHAMLVVSAGAPDLLDASELGQLFSIITKSHAIGVFLRTPAGEAGSACIHSRPLRSWVRIAAEAGAFVGEMSPLDLAPSKFLFTARTDVTPDSSALCSLVAIMSSNVGTPFEKTASSQLTIVDERRADRLEQQDLLNVHYADGFRSMFLELSQAQKQYQRNTELETQISRLQRDLEELRRQNAELEYQTSGLRPMVEAALAHSARHGHDAPCLMLGYESNDAVIDKLLADPRIGSVCVKNDRFTPLADRHSADPRVGYHFHHGDWSLPSPCEPVYFVGARHLITPTLVVHATRAGVQQLWVQVGFIWVRVPTQSLRRYTPQIRFTVRLWDRGREVLARFMSNVRMVQPFLASLTKRFMTLDEACETLVKDAQSRSGHVTGRVVLVCGSLSPGGAERQVANTLIGLAEAGVTDVLLLAHFLEDGPSRYNFHLPRVLAAGLSARRIEFATTGIDDPTIPDVLRQVALGLPANLVIDIANLVREFERLRPEVVHAWLDWDNVRAGLAAVITGVPKILLSCRNLNPSHFLLYQSYMNPAYRALAALPNVTILNNSRAGADDYADWIGISRDRIKVIQNGVAIGDQRRPARDATLLARRERGISDNDFVVGGVFRFEEEKQPLLWIDVAAHIRRAVPEARFLLYGQGSLHAAMEAKIRHLDLGDRVIFAGVTNDPLAAMCLMDVFLLTSYGEGLPNVLLEAQWIGTPVVSTRAGGAPEAIDLGVTGWVVDGNAPEALADAVVNVRRNPDVAARAAARGPVFVRERFGITRMIAETLEAYGMRAPHGDGASTADERGDKEMLKMQADA